MPEKKKSIEMDTKIHSCHSSQYSLESIKKLYIKEGFKISTTLTDKNNKKYRSYRTRKQMIEDLGHFRQHSFPDLLSSFWPFLHKKLEKTTFENDQEYLKGVNHIIQQFKKTNPQLTFFDCS